MAELGFKPWLSASGNVTPNHCKHVVGRGLGTVSSIHLLRSSGGTAKWTYDIEIDRVMVWGKWPWQVRRGSLLWWELPAEDIWQFLTATNEPHKPGGFMSPRIRGKNIACAIKERQGECMALLRLPRGKKKKESGSRKRDQAAGRRNARSQVIAKHPANLEEGLAISCKVCDCSLIGQWCCYCRYGQGCSGIFTSSWGPQRPTDKFWVVVNMTTSYRQLRILLSIFRFKIK